jgi:hypothetical protein
MMTGLRTIECKWNPGWLVNAGLSLRHAGLGVLLLTSAVSALGGALDGGPVLAVTPTFGLRRAPLSKARQRTVPGRDHCIAEPLRPYQLRRQNEYGQSLRAPDFPLPHLAKPKA